MIRHSKMLKGIALFLLVNIITTTFYPSLAYAELGPSMAEYDTFAASGTNNMVDLFTGNFNYNASLFEVPGPQSTYPINIFYNAGIKPEQEASWVGLGWNINVGSITRYVNGFADDYYKASYKITDTWQSGTPTNYGIDFPLGTNLSSTGNPTATTLPINLLKHKYYTNSLDAGNGYMYGCLNGNGVNSDTSSLKAFDCYASNEVSKSLVSNPDPEKVMGGSFPSYDTYILTGRGT